MEYCYFGSLTNTVLGVQIFPRFKVNLYVILKKSIRHAGELSLLPRAVVLSRN